MTTGSGFRVKPGMTAFDMLSPQPSSGDCRVTTFLAMTVLLMDAGYASMTAFLQPRFQLHAPVFTRVQLRLSFSLFLATRNSQQSPTYQF